MNKRLVVILAIAALVIALIVIQNWRVTCDEWSEEARALYSEDRPPGETAAEWNEKLGELVQTQPEGCDPFELRPAG